MKTWYAKIGGIHCGHCEMRITNELLKNENIKEVNINNNVAEINYDGEVTKETIIETITELGYTTQEEDIKETIEK